MGLNAFVNSINPHPQAQSMLADMGGIFSLYLNFLDVNGPFYILTPSFLTDDDSESFCGQC